MAQIRDTKLLRKIAIVLIELRDERDLNQDEIFADTGIHIGRIETAKSNISISTLSALCKYFGISLSDFFIRVEKQ